MQEDQERRVAEFVTKELKENPKLSAHLVQNESWENYVLEVVYANGQMGRRIIDSTAKSLSQMRFVEPNLTPISIIATRMYKIQQDNTPISTSPIYCTLLE